jgi:hypothetical protein
MRAILPYIVLSFLGAAIVMGGVLTETAPKTGTASAKRTRMATPRVVRLGSQ